MVIWLNGAFGAGKTSVARRLVKTLPGAWLLDPEQIGFLLRRLLPGAVPPDFQDLAVWRETTIAVVAAAAADPARTPIVPMTIAEPAYFREIVGGLRGRGIDLRHFCLLASPETLRRRLRWRLESPASKRWAMARIETCASALRAPEFAVHLETDRLTIAQVAGEIMTAAASA